MELAVNMPEQEPQVGQAFSSMRRMSSSEIVVVDGVRDRVDQVELADRAVDEGRLAGLHRAAGDEDRRDVEPHRGHQHARGDLVAVGDADQRVGAVRLDHVLDGVGDQVAGGQGVEHAAVAHGDAVVDRDGVELAGDAARRLDRLGDDPADRLEVGVAGHELGEAVGDRDDRLAEVLARYAGGVHKGSGAGHVAAMGNGAGPQLGHDGHSLGMFVRTTAGAGCLACRVPGGVIYQLPVEITPLIQDLDSALRHVRRLPGLRTPARRVVRAGRRRSGSWAPCSGCQWLVSDTAGGSARPSR